jgi:hypothetical protein
MIKGFAPIVTQVVPTTVWANTALSPSLSEVTPVFGGKSLRVWGSTISNISGGNLSVAVMAYPPTNAGYSAFMSANQTIVVPIPFIIGNNSGLSVTSTVSGGVSVTFFHSNIT